MRQQAVTLLRRHATLQDYCEAAQKALLAFKHALGRLGSAAGSRGRASGASSWE